jgi:hypothetical protein
LFMVHTLSVNMLGAKIEIFLISGRGWAREMLIILLLVMVWFS